jgi:hypothetical protein
MISKEKADYICSLADKDGYIDPHSVVEAARNPNSPIHNDFQWSVAAAAQENWLDQARALIRFVKVNVTINRRTVAAPYYVPDPERPTRSARYIELTIAGRNAEVAQQIMMAEMDRIAAAIKRAQQIAEVLGLSKMLDDLLEDVTTIRTAAERRREAKAVAGGKRKPRKSDDVRHV